MRAPRDTGEADPRGRRPLDDASLVDAIGRPGQDVETGRGSGGLERRKVLRQRPEQGVAPRAIDRTSMVAYLMPVVGIVLGVAVASEPIDLRMVAGTALIIGGVALVNTRYGRRRLFGRREVARGEDDQTADQPGVA